MTRGSRGGRRGRSSKRTPLYDLDQASHEQLNAGTSYRVRLQDGVFSISARPGEDSVHYYMTKRVRGHLFKTYVATGGEVTAQRIHEAARDILTKIEASAAEFEAHRRRGGREMRRRGDLGTIAVFDLLDAYDIVLEAPLEERQELYDMWRENANQVLALLIPPEDAEAWMTFSSRGIDWSSKPKADLQLQSVKAYLRALMSK